MKLLIVITVQGSLKNNTKLIDTKLGLQSKSCSIKLNSLYLAIMKKMQNFNLADLIIYRHMLNIVETFVNI